jgi:fumarate reductase subunit D
VDTPAELKVEAKRAARKATDNPVLRVLARAGYVANGLVHAIVAIIVLVLAFGGSGESDQSGAFKALAVTPLGHAALWMLAVTLCALAAWHAAEGLAVRDGRGDVKGAAQKWGRRAAEWGQALVFAALGAIAGSVALGAEPDAEQTAEDASRGLISIPGGPLVLGAVGLAIGGGGIAFVVMGVLRSFENKVDIPDGALGATVRALGIVGFIAKGVALIVIGIILVIAAVRLDPQTAGGLDGAMEAILRLPAGPFLAGLVAVGFLAYAVFCVFRARYARL